MPNSPQLPLNIKPETIISVCSEYMKQNDGDEDTQIILLSMTADMLNISPEVLITHMR